MATIFRTEKNIDFKMLDCFIRSNIPSGMCIRETPSAYIDSHSEVVSEVDDICRIINDDSRRDTFLNSLGILGGGNHFIEIDRISNNTYLLAVHTGSRSLGLNICKYFQRHSSVIDEELKRSIIEKHNSAVTTEEHMAIQNEIGSIQAVSGELGYISGELYDCYISCMLSAMRYAYANRESISDEIMNYLISNEAVETIERFDTVHNYIDFFDDERIIIRKGAISANSGQPGVID